MRKNTEYNGDLNENCPRIVWLWSILDELSEIERVKIVKFCWAQERLPSSQEEFDKLQIKFKIKPAMNTKSLNGFPKADTCFFILELPDYSSKEIMKSKILLAVNFDNVSINNDKPRDNTVISRNVFRRNDNFDDYDAY